MYSIFALDVVRLCNGIILSGDDKLVLNNFCTDTRVLKSGDVYVGISGERLDGNDFYLEAINKGASCLILSKKPDELNVDDVTIILVEDTLKCLQELASYKRSLFNIPVVAVTGSVGKTSTKDIIYSVLSKKYKVSCTVGNYNNHLGLPLTILGMDDKSEVLVVEMGMNHFKELSLLSKIAKPTLAVITNIGTAHIGNLGSRENILKAKLEILEGLVGVDVVLNIDDDMLFKAYIELKDKYNIKTVSVREDSDYKAINLKLDVFDSKFDIINEIGDVVVNVGGIAYVYNALIAYTIGKHFNIAEGLIKEGIAEFKLTGGRLEKKVSKRGMLLIDDTYNANYDSMKASIELVSKVKNRRKVAILGDMLELGDYTEELHLKLGDVVVSNQIDVLITVGEYSKLIGKRAMELGMKREVIFTFDKESDSYSFLADYLDKDDIVLLKGSHGIKLFNLVDYLVNLD